MAFEFSSPKGDPTIRNNFIRVNQRIRAREVRVIVGSTNEQLGVLRTSDALKKAQQLGLDLVEISPNASPPVCKIVDYGKYRYEAAKAEKDRKHATSRLKEVKFRANISEHDYMTKIRHAEEFLDKGNKVKLTLQFRGREMAHQEIGMEVVMRAGKDLDGVAQIENPARKAGRQINMVLAPLPANKRNRKFAPPEEPFVEDVPDEADDHEEDEDAHHPTS